MERQEPGCQKQFEAAVRVIQGLPKNGSYRPPYEVMLRFYSYYKQATVGSCEVPRPGFWDPIGRYKWDAWNRLGKMPREEAMAAYVSEMKKIAQKVIDTVPAGETSEDTFGFFKPLYEVIHDMPSPPESFFKKAGRELGQADAALESSQVPSDSDSEAYGDPLEQAEPGQAGQPLSSLDTRAGRESLARAPVTPGEAGLGAGELDGRSSAGPQPERGPQAAPGTRGSRDRADAAPKGPAGAGLPPELDVRLLGAVRALQDDMQSVLKRLSRLEMLSAPQKPPRGPLVGSARTLLFLLLWPFVAQWLLQRWRRAR
ncbi:acyl-CoA-binding domain-containing protein 4 isoform X2 [Pelodiscus sinensis]|uniref:acyl-CoA-binding domain-containing protein 4 isoform X2 n=1 Tax=Pelodiscus sinensis TaxID=13735 RepID=UPI003F6CF99A